MPTFTEWVAGVDRHGNTLPRATVEYYRKVADLLPDRTLPAPTIFDCIHRGPVIDHRKANLCGRRGEMFPVFQCSIHGECVLTRFCEKQREKVCYLCDEAEAKGSVETREQVPQE